MLATVIEIDDMLLAIERSFNQTWQTIGRPGSGNYVHRWTGIEELATFQLSNTAHYSNYRLGSQTPPADFADAGENFVSSTFTY